MSAQSGATAAKIDKIEKKINKTEIK